MFSVEHFTDSKSLNDQPPKVTKGKKAAAAPYPERRAGTSKKTKVSSSLSLNPFLSLLSAELLIDGVVVVLTIYVLDATVEPSYREASPQLWHWTGHPTQAQPLSHG